MTPFLITVGNSKLEFYYIKRIQVYICPQLVTMASLHSAHSKPSETVHNFSLFLLFCVNVTKEKWLQISLINKRRTHYKKIYKEMKFCVVYSVYDMYDTVHSFQDMFFLQSLFFTESNQYATTIETILSLKEKTQSNSYLALF